MNIQGFLPSSSLAEAAINRIPFSFHTARRDPIDDRFHNLIFPDAHSLSFHACIDLIVMGTHQARMLKIAGKEVTWSEVYQIPFHDTKTVKSCVKQVAQTCAIMRYEAAYHQILQQGPTFSAAELPYRYKGKITLLTLTGFDDLKPTTEENIALFHDFLMIFSEVLHYQSSLRIVLVDPVNHACRVQLRALVKAINQVTEGSLHYNRNRILYVATGKLLQRHRFVAGTPALFHDNKTLSPDGAAIFSEGTIRAINGYLDDLEEDEGQLHRPGGLVRQLEIPTLHPNWNTG